ncbi:hypothetical protein [Nocardia sp. NPDC052566]
MGCRSASTVIPSAERAVADDTQWRHVMSAPAGLIAPPQAMLNGGM